MTIASSPWRLAIGGRSDGEDAQLAGDLADGIEVVRRRIRFYGEDLASCGLDDGRTY